jgi:hypothetical protein
MFRLLGLIVQRYLGIELSQTPQKNRQQLGPPWSYLAPGDATCSHLLITRKMIAAAARYIGEWLSSIASVGIAIEWFT